MKGFTKACPSCRKVLLRYANFKGEGSFETRCPHCGVLVLVKLEVEPCIKIEKIVKVAILIILFGMSLASVYVLSQSSKEGSSFLAGIKAE